MKRLYIILTLVLLALVVAGFVYWRYFYLGSITIDPVPSEAIITVNGQPTSERTKRLPRGSYTITVTAPGYRAEQLTVELGTGEQISRRVTLIALPRPEKVLDGPIHSLAMSENRKTIFFAKKDILYRYQLTAAAGTPPEAITPSLAGISRVDWSPDFELALLHKTDGEVWLYDFRRYNLLNQEYYPLDKNLKQTAWDSKADGFYAAQVTQTGEQTLIKLNRAGKAPTVLAFLNALPFTDLVFTPGPENQLLISSSEQKKPADIVLFNAHQRIYQPLTDSGAAYAPVLSPDKKRFLYLDNGELVVADISGANKRNLGLRPRTGNYAFTETGKAAVLTPNTITVVNTTDASRETFEVFAPSDKVSAFTASSEQVYYLYSGALYRLNFKEPPPQVR